MRKNIIRCSAYILININKEYTAMGYMDKFTKPEDFRRDELIRIIEHSVENLTLQELEALYYDMTTKNFINE